MWYFLCRNKWRTREPNRQEVSYLSILFKHNLSDKINFSVFNTLYKSLIDWVSIYGFMQIELVVTCMHKWDEVTVYNTTTVYSLQLSLFCLFSLWCLKPICFISRKRWEDLTTNWLWCWILSVSVTSNMLWRVE